MSALAEALVAAQRRALSAMEKHYVSGRVEAEEARQAMDSPDLPLNKQEAHEVIDTLKAGSYDYAKWHVAF